MDNLDVMKMERECTIVRNKIKDMADEVKTLRDMAGLMALSDESFGEGKANVMLAYRHLEDARMRVGKIMQCLQGGVSKYDKVTEPIPKPGTVLEVDDLKKELADQKQEDKKNDGE